MNRRLISNALGWLGLACSLAFWVWIGIFARLSFAQHGNWQRFEFGVSNLWPALWLAGLLLLLVAAVLGSKKWVLAAFVPVISCAAAIIYYSKFHS